MSDNSYILVVDDENTIREVVRRYLEHEGFMVKEAADGYEALEIIQDAAPTLIVLDLMLPGIDGLTLTQHLRQDREIPIIMLTAKGEASDRIRGLDLGADDYIAKPFNPQELVSRVRAVLRRIGGSEISTLQQPIDFGNLSIDPAARHVEIKGQSVTLTAKEFDLLWFFAQHPQQVFTRTQLLSQVWGDKLYTDPTTVTVHIRRLREKIEINASQPDQIQTVWGVGYKFLGK
ncbi:MAG: response regulator transcription factor [Anaerolineae bacterium]|nr:response regulator transcription factor [Anaerolineae bacterium]